MFRWKGNTADCFLLLFCYSVIIPLNTSTGGLFSRFTLSSFHAVSKSFLYFFRKVLLSLACIENGSSGQLLPCLLSHNEQNKVSGYWTLLLCTRQMFQLLQPRAGTAQTPLPSISSIVLDQSSAFGSVLDNERGQWTETAFRCGQKKSTTSPAHVLLLCFLSASSNGRERADVS